MLPARGNLPDRPNRAAVMERLVAAAMEGMRQRELSARIPETECMSHVNAARFLLELYDHDRPAALGAFSNYLKSIDGAWVFDSTGKRGHRFDRRYAGVKNQMRLLEKLHPH